MTCSSARTARSGSAPASPTPGRPPTSAPASTRLANPTTGRLHRVEPGRRDRAGVDHDLRPALRRRTRSTRPPAAASGRTRRPSTTGAWTQVFAPNPDLPGRAARKAGDPNAPYKNIVNNIQIDPKNAAHVIAGVGWRGGDAYNGFYETRRRRRDLGQGQPQGRRRLDRLHRHRPDLAGVLAGRHQALRPGAVDEALQQVHRQRAAATSRASTSPTPAPWPVRGRASPTRASSPTAARPSSSRWAARATAPASRPGTTSSSPSTRPTPTTSTSASRRSTRRATAAPPGRPSARTGTSTSAAGAPTCRDDQLGCNLTTHPDQHAIAFGQRGGKPAVFVGNDGGVYARPVAGKEDREGHATDWTSLNDGTMDVLQYYAVDAGDDPALGGGDAVSGGLQDNGGSILRAEDTDDGLELRRRRRRRPRQPGQRLQDRPGVRLPVAVGDPKLQVPGPGRRLWR